MTTYRISNKPLKNLFLNIRYFRFLRLLDMWDDLERGSEREMDYFKEVCDYLNSIKDSEVELLAFVNHFFGLKREKDPN